MSDGSRGTGLLHALEGAVGGPCTLAPMVIDVTVFNDPGCPWAYSEIPSLTLMRWRYGDQLRWRLVTIGLTERAEQYEQRGYTAADDGAQRAGLPALSRPRKPTAPCATPLPR